MCKGVLQLINWSESIGLPVFKPGLDIALIRHGEDLTSVRPVEKENSHASLNEVLLTSFCRGTWSGTTKLLAVISRSFATIWGSGVRLWCLKISSDENSRTRSHGCVIPRTAPTEHVFHEVIKKEPDFILDTSSTVNDTRTGEGLLHIPLENADGGWGC